MRGIAGAIAMAFDAENVSFGVGAGLLCAGLVWLAHGLGRISRRSGRAA